MAVIGDSRVAAVLAAAVIATATTAQVYPAALAVTASPIPFLRWALCARARDGGTRTRV